MDWKTAILDDNLTPTQFAYIDSGPVPGDTYTTLVLVHGHTYHARTFEPLFPHAEKHNLRLVAFNRRDYTGSTLLTPSELSILNTDSTDPEADAKHKAFLADRGLDVLRFLSWFVKHNNIPRPVDLASEGELALLGWSAGTISVLAFLRHGASYPKELVGSVEPYLRTVLLYELASSAHGYPSPPNAYHPLLDPAIPPHLKTPAFNTWVSSYYTHPSLESGSKSKSISGLQLSIPSSPTRPATVSQIPPEILEKITDTEAGGRSEDQYYKNVKKTVMYEQFYGALFHPVTTSEAWPDVKVEVVYCRETAWTVHWGMWELAKDMKSIEEESASKGLNLKGREVRVTMSEKGNHFFHWDDPEDCLAFFVNSIRRTIERQN